MVNESGKLKECCEICGEQATWAIADLWCYPKGNWLCYNRCGVTFRCDDHCRDSIIKTIHRGVFERLCRKGDSVILVEDL